MNTLQAQDFDTSLGTGNTLTDDMTESEIAQPDKNPKHKDKQMMKLKHTSNVMKTHAFAMHTEEELRPYRPFRKIYVEMKYARESPQQPLSLLDLPAELRIKIYRYAFVFAEPIEFWPETDTTSHDHRSRTKTHYELRTLLYRRRLNLSFLRTCRRIHAEGSEVFYGENTFRFSAINGHMAANLFVRKIYKQHFQWLTTLTIPMPFISSGKGTHWSNQNPWSKRTHNMVRDALPFSAWVDKWFEYDDAFQHLVWNLQRAERFRKLVLVLPEWYQPHGYRAANVYKTEESWDKNDAVWEAFDALVEAKDELQIEIIRLCDEKTVWSEMWDLEIEAWKNYGMHESHAYLIRRFKAMARENVEVQVKGAYVHPRGEWRVLAHLPEDAFLPEERPSNDTTYP